MAKVPIINPKCARVCGNKMSLRRKNLDPSFANNPLGRSSSCFIIVLYWPRWSGQGLVLTAIEVGQLLPTAFVYSDTELGPWVRY